MNKKCEELLADESFQSWFAHTASTQECEKWATWLKADFTHQSIFEQARLIWESVRFSSDSAPDVEVEWNRLQQRLNLKAQTRAIMKPHFFKNNIAQISANFNELRHKANAWPRYAALAAVLFVIVLAWRFMPLSGEQGVQTIATQFGEREQFILADGTKIVLNANSIFRLKQSSDGSGTSQVELLGEAYFDVIPRGKDFQQPRLVVQTADGIVQVIGTKFTVHNRDEGTAVAVERGSVRVLVGNNPVRTSAFENHAVILNQGSYLKFNKGDEVLYPEITNVAVYTSWWTDQLIFDNTPIGVIIKRLEETYGVNIEMQSPQLFEQRISGSIENGDLQIIITALAKIMQCTIQEQNDTLVFIKSKN